MIVKFIRRDERQYSEPCSILAWEILFTEEPGSLQSMGSQKVRHHLVTGQTNDQIIQRPLPWWLSQQWIRLQCGRPGFDPWVGKIPLRRAWQSTPVFLPGKSLWTEEPGGLQSMGSQRVGHNSEWLSTLKLKNKKINPVKNGPNPSKTYHQRPKMIYRWQINIQKDTLDHMSPGKCKLKQQQATTTCLLLLSHFSRVRLFVTP